ncbi:UNVERIFIED_CONTAM: hypothetical protein Sangu_2458200 [Sesamum angustifolium]|uniref:Reverse transcriptase domain-containing protein n=1 Tax=Sesamum angustifolium TaxID=2727405 RepID=A0AAW2KX46_9LAMI
MLPLRLFRKQNNLFSSSNPNEDDIARGTENLRRVVDTSMEEDLLRPYSKDEVTKALFQMAPLKSPGPDGMPPIFFQKFWRIVKHDVIACVLHLLNAHVMPPSLNETNIVLIPKCKNPINLTQFRPISLCNVVYKIASKTVANRLKLILDHIISPAQSAFVPHRLITDNILLAFKLNHFLNTKTTGKQGYMAMKLDVSKAYDKVEWAFLEQVMAKLGFPSSFLRLIMLFVSSVSYSFMNGGQQFGIFQFFIAESRNGWSIRGVSICRNAPYISHLLFADDTLIFSQASSDSARHIKEILEIYRMASGQEINFQKSSVAFSKNCCEEVKRAIVLELEIRTENKMELYLGLPSRAARSKKELFASIRDKVWKRINGWNEKILSQAGKEVLIKSVIQAIPTYAMGCFKLPVTLLTEIQSLISNFWWHNRGQNKIHWISWQRLCDSKLQGGIGFRQLHLFNLAMLAKQLWRIHCFPDRLLSQVLKARYFPHGNIFEASLSRRPSYTWRSLIAAQDIFRAGCRWRVGSGTSICIWKDPWLPRPLTFGLITPPLGHMSEMKVSDLIDPQTQDWNAQLIRSIFWSVDSDLILGIPLGHLGLEDQIVWHHTKNGIFSVRSAYHLARTLEERPCSSTSMTAESDWWRKLWQLKLPSKIKVFTWRACLNALPTAANLNKRLKTESFSCPFCAASREDIIHTLLLCPFARQVWSLSNLRWVSLYQNSAGILIWMQDMAKKLNNQDLILFLSLCCIGSVHLLLLSKSTVTELFLSRVWKWGWELFARDDQGSCLWWSSKRITRGGNGEIAEAMAVRHGLELGARLGWSSVIIESDCANLISKILSPDHDMSFIGPIVADSRTLAASFQLCSFNLVPRYCNTVAHVLAKSGVGSLEGISNLPAGAADLVLADISTS